MNGLTSCPSTTWFDGSAVSVWTPKLDMRVAAVPVSAMVSVMALAVRVRLPEASIAARPPLRVGPGGVSAAVNSASVEISPAPVPNVRLVLLAPIVMVSVSPWPTRPRSSRLREL